MVNGRFFTTSGEVPASRGPAWGRVVTHYFGGLDACCDDDVFDAQLRQYEVGSMRVFRISAPAHRIVRPAGALHDHGSDYFKLLLQLSGASEIEQHGKLVRLCEGDWSLYDPRMPYCLSNLTHVEQLVIQIPRKQLSGVAPTGLHTSNVHEFELKGLFSLLSSFLVSLSEQLPALPGTTGIALSETILGLLVSALAAQRDAHGAHVTLPAVLRMRVKQYIHGHLADADLSIERIARELRCSKRYLHRIFEEEGVTIDRYIWSSRLERCREMLAATRTAKPAILEIALSWGFSSGAHFCRSFKQRYGMTPREFVRQRAPA
ncbi:helix-turn-helix domain-containing protein [Burkholderia sp. TSV86]|uniref:AraC-like ligand-binding domain-containing protein n=1 Tax=Burkholderia sp. TSV86 TaxID=1385594 RepID=UPI00075E0243|nr:helix-turn-helix domain-containing protein [Burkholderia sp. TSV86]KVE35171.1 AraC family transcriptional regulator [Burkholderia sp. TSV86]